MVRVYDIDTFLPDRRANVDLSYQHASLRLQRYSAWKLRSSCGRFPQISGKTEKTRLSAPCRMKISDLAAHRIHEQLEYDAISRQCAVSCRSEAAGWRAAFSP